jgi:uracil-DNA glycosylase
MTVASARRVQHALAGASVVRTYHPSPLSMNRAPGRRDEVVADFRLVRDRMSELKGVT